MTPTPYYDRDGIVTYGRGCHVFTHGSTNVNLGFIGKGGG